MRENPLDIIKHEGKSKNMNKDERKSHGYDTHIKFQGI